MGIVERNVVDAGMRKVQCVTIFLLAFLALAMVAALVRSIKTDLRFVLAEQEEAFHRESTERQKMEDLANTDGLTGLSNERFFNATLQKKEKAGEPFALFYLDLDSFKPVNDTYGHDVGDQLLKEVASRLRGCVRESDAVFRIGGDEFVILSAHMTLTDGRRAVRWLRDILRESDYEISVGLHLLEKGESISDGVDLSLIHI